MEKDRFNETDTTVEEMQQEPLEKWLTFRLDSQLYGASILHTEQIISMMPVTVVPEYPAYAKGVIDLRGMIIPVIDMRLRFGKPEAAYTERTCIITCRMEEDLIGFIVDEVDAVIDIDRDAISPPPRVSEDPNARYLTGIARVSGENGAKEKIVLCIDVTKILRREELQTLIRE